MRAPRVAEPDSESQSRNADPVEPPAGPNGSPERRLRSSLEVSSQELSLLLVNDLRGRSLPTLGGTTTQTFAPTREK